MREAAQTQQRDRCSEKDTFEHSAEQVKRLHKVGRVFPIMLFVDAE